MKKIILFISGFLAVLFTNDIIAQNVTIDGEFRPRFENRHGYSTIFPKDAQAANYISQRSRLNLRFENENFKVGFSLQNVGVWGESKQLNTTDVNGTMIHEAWGEILFCEKFSIKAGRQEIIYDDHRIFGNVDWAQQGRSHDALVMKLKPNDECNVDIGFAYNAFGESLTKIPYMQNNYKTFQYFHWHRNFGDFGASLLFLNNGMPYINSYDTTDAGVAKENVAYSQTFGPRVTYKKNKFSANAAFYYQMGNRTLLDMPTADPVITMDSTYKLSAFYFALDVSYDITDLFSVGAGLEYLSGNDEKKIADDLMNGNRPEAENAFTPFYGTNHKFNGWMDYFYVGNHANTVGLMDIYVPIKFKKDKFTAMLIPHFFSSAGTMYRHKRDSDWNLENNPDGSPVMEELSKSLGTEIDFSVGYAVSKAVGIQAGYSMMLASESMEYLKNTQAETGNTWGWVMLVFKPTFYKSDKSN